MSRHYDGWPPYVPVAERRRKAMREMEKLKKKGHPVAPVVIEGRTIAKTFWGKAWCDNLERYSDYENRLPRGRTYVRNGSVVDLHIAPGEVKAYVSGSKLYRIAVKIEPVPKPRWNALVRDCAGAIDSLVELLQGRFSKGVMEHICRQETGLFPSPKEIKLSCSCPDSAYMCKHVAAVLYGIGARLDQQPELLFKLRQVDEMELIATAGEGLTLSTAVSVGDKILGQNNLSELFGLDMADVQPTVDESMSTVKPKRGRPPKAASGKLPATTNSKAKAKKTAGKPATGGNKLKPEATAVSGEKETAPKANAGTPKGRKKASSTAKGKAVSESSAKTSPMGEKKAMPKAGKKVEVNTDGPAEKKKKASKTRKKVSGKGRSASTKRSDAG